MHFMTSHIFLMPCKLNDQTFAKHTAFWSFLAVYESIICISQCLVFLEITSDRSKDLLLHCLSLIYPKFASHISATSPTQTHPALNSFHGTPDVGCPLLLGSQLHSRIFLNKIKWHDWISHDWCPLNIDCDSIEPFLNRLPSAACVHNCCASAFSHKASKLMLPRLTV